MQHTYLQRATRPWLLTVPFYVYYPQINLNHNHEFGQVRII